ELYYHLGIAAKRLGEEEEAITYYQLAIEQAVLPLIKVGAYNNLGNLYEAQGNLDAARSQYEMVVRLNPHLALGYYNLGLIKKQKGDLWGAIASYQTALHLKPDYTEAYQNLGVTLFKLGQLPESMDAFQKAIVLHQKSGNLGEAQKLAHFLREITGS
ncbi:MAG: tetratricopeptide repeat protein, partial [Prochlorotrichaceae cyanobacterium]